MLRTQNDGGGKEKEGGGGGADSVLPPLVVLDSSKTAEDIDTKLSIPSPASIWRLPFKFQKNSLRFFEKMF